MFQIPSQLGSHLLHLEGLDTQIVLAVHAIEPFDIWQFRRDRQEHSGSPKKQTKGRYRTRPLRVFRVGQVPMKREGVRCGASSNGSQSESPKSGQSKPGRKQISATVRKTCHRKEAEGCKRPQMRAKESLNVKIANLDGGNRVIVIAESLARVIAAIRITSVRWRSYPPKHTEISPHSPLRSLCRNSNRASGVHLCNIRSAWNCGMACES